MPRYRKIQRDGGGAKIHLSPLDLKDFSINIGDEVNIEDIVPKPKKSRKHKNGK